MPPSLEGRVLGGRFRVGRALGEGGMGAVYEAVQLGLERPVALKVLAPELSEDPGFVERFRREAETAARLMHPNIVQVTDFVSLPGEPVVIVMELLRGRSLLDALNEGPMSVARACTLTAQLASALAAAHAAGVVHRDLKPANVLLVPMAGTEMVKLLDFGIAKLKESDGYSRLTATGVLIGTPRFASPEQVSGRRDIDHRSDIFSLGVLLYGMLTGQPPFQGRGAELLIEIQDREPLDPRSRVPSIPPALVAVVQRAMQKRPEDRIGSMLELAHALTPFLSGDARPPAGVAYTPPPALGDAPTGAAVPSNVARSVDPRAMHTAAAVPSSVARSVDPHAMHTAAAVPSNVARSVDPHAMHTAAAVPSNVARSVDPHAMHTAAAVPSNVARLVDPHAMHPSNVARAVDAPRSVPPSAMPLPSATPTMAYGSSGSASAPGLAPPAAYVPAAHVPATYVPATYVPAPGAPLSHGASSGTPPTVVLSASLPPPGWRPHPAPWNALDSTVGGLRGSMPAPARRVPWLVLLPIGVVIAVLFVAAAFVVEALWLTRGGGTSGERADDAPSSTTSRFTPSEAAAAMGPDCVEWERRACSCVGRLDGAAATCELARSTTGDAYRHGVARDVAIVTERCTAAARTQYDCGSTLDAVPGPPPDVSPRSPQGIIWASTRARALGPDCVRYLERSCCDSGGDICRVTRQRMIESYGYDEAQVLNFRVACGTMAAAYGGDCAAQ